MPVESFQFAEVTVALDTPGASQAMGQILKGEGSRRQLLCRGEWTLSGIPKLAAVFKELSSLKKTNLVLNLSQVTAMDSSGAFELSQLIKQLTQQANTVTLDDLAPRYQALLELTQKAEVKKTLPPEPATRFESLVVLGKQTLDFIKEVSNYLAFVGQSALMVQHVLLRPVQLRWRAIVNIVESTGYQALPIIALLSFMIGVVLTYQMGVQLKNYGANIFMVDLLGLAIFREFGPLLTAIMVAGRTGSAFAAQLGSMKIGQELDALNTMGVPPQALLVLPRLFGLIISLPLLTIWSDLFGVLGGMVMSKSMLNIYWYDFIVRFRAVVSVKSFLLGLGKAPVFALLIGSIGCFQGLQVTGSAESVGQKTTRSVVQAIFFIILADAGFSILFSEFNL